MNDADRPRGILSPADREYLLGEAEMAHEQSRRNAEARIRQRVTDAVLDFGLLVHALSEKDRRQIFEKGLDDEAFADGLMTMLAFAYMGLKEQGVDFEHVLVPAIRKSEEVYAADALGSTVGVDVTFDVETTVETELDDVHARIREHEPVTPTELFSTVVAGDSAIADASSIVLQLGTDEDRDDYVDRFARFLDADVEELPLNRVRLRLPDDGIDLANGAGAASESTDD